MLQTFIFYYTDKKLLISNAPSSSQCAVLTSSTRISLSTVHRLNSVFLFTQEPPLLRLALSIRATSSTDGSAQQVDTAGNWIPLQEYCEVKELKARPEPEPLWSVRHTSEFSSVIFFVVNDFMFSGDITVTITENISLFDTFIHTTGL